MHVIAKEEVEVQRLDEQIADTRSRLAKEKEQLLRLKNDLATGKSEFTLCRPHATRPTRFAPIWPTGSTATRPARRRWRA